MRNYLKINSFILIFFFSPTFTSCVTSSYLVLHRAEWSSGIIATGDRIIFSCEDVQDPESPIEPDGRYGFMIWVLDDQKTATNFVQTSIVTKKDCLNRMDRLEKLKRVAKRFYIAGHGDIDEVESKPEKFYNFPDKGAFKENGKSIGFAVFKADNGECFTKNFGSGNPCPKVVGFPRAEQVFQSDR
jgi:hypothetical protein